MRFRIKVVVEYFLVANSIIVAMKEASELVNNKIGNHIVIDAQVSEAEPLPASE